jgi:hypothetical protein
MALGDADDSSSRSAGNIGRLRNTLNVVFGARQRCRGSETVRHRRLEMVGTG